MGCQTTMRCEAGNTTGLVRLAGGAMSVQVHFPLVVEPTRRSFIGFYVDIRSEIGEDFAPVALCLITHFEQSLYLS